MMVMGGIQSMTALETIQALCDLTKEHGSTFEVATDQCGLYLDVKIPGHEMSIRYYVSDKDYPGLLAERHPELDQAIRQHCRGMIGWLEEWGEQNRKFRAYCPQSVRFNWTKKGRLSVHWTTVKDHTFQLHQSVGFSRSEFPLLDMALAHQGSQQLLPPPADKQDGNE